VRVSTVGVPEIIPVVVLNINPAGRDGLMLYESTFPSTAGTSGVMVTPSANTFGVGYDRLNGGMSFTVISIPKVMLPPEFVAVTVAGVPEMIPVAVSNTSPFGNVGEMLNESIFPVIVGSSGVIAVPTVNTFGVLYESTVGATSFTVMTIPNETDPPVLDAVTVYVAVVVTVAGVPEITPVVVFNVRPLGSAGDTLNSSAVPWMNGTSGVIAVPTVNVFGDV